MSLFVRDCLALVLAVLGGLLAAKAGASLGLDVPLACLVGWTSGAGIVGAYLWEGH